MHVTLVMVQTVNGLITKEDDPHIHAWTSKEDQDFFKKLRDSFSVIVMGRSTYEVIRDQVKNDVYHRRIILTRNPDTFKSDSLSGIREFTKEDPADLLARLEGEGVEKVLLVGGGETNKEFFRKNLVNDLYITLEPVLFGKGKPMTGYGDYSISLRLVSQRTFNEKGSLLLHYRVIS